MLTVEVRDRIILILYPLLLRPSRHLQLTSLDLLPHQGSGAVGCSENAPHAEDQPPRSGYEQADGANPTQRVPTT